MSSSEIPPALVTMVWKHYCQRLLLNSHYVCVYKQKDMQQCVCSLNLSSLPIP